MVFKKSAKSAVLERLARQRGESGSYRGKSVMMLSSQLGTDARILTSISLMLLGVKV